MVSHKEELDRIDELVSQLEERMDTPQGLMREHLLAARTYIVDEMPDELKMQLELVRGGLAQVDDSEMHSRVEDLLRALEDNARSRPK